MIAVDISHWSEDVDFAILKLGGVDLCIPKLTQGNYKKDSKFDDFLQDMRTDGMPFGVFHYDDPDISVYRQADWIKMHMPADARFLALDLEKTGPKKGIKYNPVTLMAHIISLYNECAKLGKPLILYTRMTYIKDYCPGLWPWLKTKRLWIAAYPELRTWAERLRKGIKLSWAELKTRMLRLPTGPTAPYGINCMLWQFSGDTFVLPGCKKTMDLNLFRGTLDEFLKLL
jgi:GH25 family lysozyme M1 (1,4-beta-N-acetylmuramidase)